MKAMKGEATIGENVVLRLCEGLRGVGRVIIMDNFSSSLKIFETMDGWAPKQLTQSERIE